MDYRKIKEIMKDRKYTLEELSELSGIPLSTLSKNHKAASHRIPDTTRWQRSPRH